MVASAPIQRRPLSRARVSASVSQEPLPSATVIITRDVENGLEVLLLQRTPRKPGDRRAPWVFPGGKVEAVDRSSEDDPVATGRRAAVREVLEESGLKIDPETLLPISRWITPEISPKRFDTLFFLTQLEDRQEVEVDGVEIERYDWMQPEAALARSQAGEISLAPPTFVTISWLETFPDGAAAREALARHSLLTFRPQICRTEEGTCMLYPGDAGYEEGDPGREGARHRLWALETGWRYERDT